MRDHDAVVYQASAYENVAPVIHVFPLCELARQDINALSTLYIPPAMRADPDPYRAELLGVRLTDLSLSRRQGSGRIPGQAYGLTHPEKPGWVTGSPSPHGSAPA